MSTHNIMFLLRNKKDINTFGLKRLAVSGATVTLSCSKFVHKEVEYFDKLSYKL